MFTSFLFSSSPHPHPPPLSLPPPLFLLSFSSPLFSLLHTPHNSVVFDMVPPTKLLIAMLMFWLLPLRANDTLSRISGISLAMGARKNARRMGFTFMDDAASTTHTMKGLENVKMSVPPVY